VKNSFEMKFNLKDLQMLPINILRYMKFSCVYVILSLQSCCMPFFSRLLNLHRLTIESAFSIYSLGSCCSNRRSFPLMLIQSITYAFEHKESLANLAIHFYFSYIEFILYTTKYIYVVRIDFHIR
jgi:hypothetical protein